MRKTIRMILCLAIVQSIFHSNIFAGDEPRLQPQDISEEDRTVMENMDLLENLDQFQEDLQMLSNLRDMEDTNEQDR